MVKTLAGAAFLLLSLGGCAGYSVGPIQPYYLRSVHSIAVPTFENRTFIPRISVLVTDSVIKQFQQDGTYRIAGDDQADAILKGEITRITRAPARSVARERARDDGIQSCDAGSLFARRPRPRRQGSGPTKGSDWHDQFLCRCRHRL